VQNTLLTYRFSAGALRPTAEAQWLQPETDRHIRRGFCWSLPRPKSKPERANYRPSNVSPEARQQRLAAAGFVEYPRVENVPTSIGAFKRDWENRLNTGETADTEYTGTHHRPFAANHV